MKMKGVLTGLTMALMAVAIPVDAEISEACKRHPFTIYELDEFEGTEVAILARFKRKGLGFAAVKPLLLAGGGIPGVHRTKSRAFYVALDGSGSAMVVILSPRWKHLSPDAPLKVKSGDEVYEYPALPSSAATAVLRRVDMESNLLEWQAYAADREALLALAEDPKSLFRVQKKDSWIDIQVLKTHHKRLAEWVKICVTPRPD